MWRCMACLVWLTLGAGCDGALLSVHSPPQVVHFGPPESSNASGGGGGGGM